MKEHIDEMARIIGAAIEFDELDFGMDEKTEIIAEKAAKKFYNAGYRKQSENTVEIVRCKECRNCEKVPSMLGIVLYCNEWCKDVDEDTFCSFGAKMKGGAK